MARVWTTIGLLILSNIFMTYAWYGHLKDLKDRPWLVAALVSWGIAFFEYMIQVPANLVQFNMPLAFVCAFRKYNLNRFGWY